MSGEKESLLDKYTRLKNKSQPASIQQSNATSPEDVEKSTPKNATTVPSAAAAASSPAPTEPDTMSNTPIQTVSNSPIKRRRRSISLESSTSVDAFGRVKRKKRKRNVEGIFKEDGEEEASEGSDNGYGRRRSWSRSRSRSPGYWGRGRSRSRSVERGRRRGGWGSRSRSRSRSLSIPEFAEKTVHVSEISMDICRADIRDHFYDIGEITEIKMFEGKRYCFVTFSTRREMENAIDTLDNSMLLGTRIKVTRARNPERNRMIRNLEQELARHPIPDYIAPDPYYNGDMLPIGGPVHIFDPLIEAVLEGKLNDEKPVIQEDVKVVLKARSKDIPPEDLEEGELSDEE
ncbi:hypothetical protein HDU76_012964, partial [Blyttiomyces sp. JEL0837]